MNDQQGQYLTDSIRELTNALINGQIESKHYGFYQLCPKCEGWGEVRLPETSTPMFGTCPVCNGAKLLVRPEIKEDKTQQP